MSLGEIGTILIVLVITFIIGHTWFYIVEGVLGGLKRIFGKKRPTVWHTLPQDKKYENKNDKL